MIPREIYIVDDLPLNKNGKIDYSKLNSKLASLESNTEKVAPNTQTEKKLTEIWMEILAITEVGITDNFFDVGGHSLLATQVVSRIRNKFSISISIKTIFDYPTIESLASEIEQVTFDCSSLKKKNRPRILKKVIENE